MTVSNKCLLCKSAVYLYYEDNNKVYYKCKNCSAIMLDSKNYLSSSSEKSRNKTHNNDVNDSRYQKFVSPIVQSVKQKYNKNSLGLDFGAGTGPVITFMLEKEGYKLNLFDPYFHNHPENLNITYDYIVCSEVMEHFYNPYDEFKRLSKMLHSNGSIFCLTEIYNDSVDFVKWYYKNDETHVFFYHKKSLEWIKERFKFSKLEIEGRLIKLIK